MVRDSRSSSFTRSGGKFSSIKLTTISLLEKKALNVVSWGLLDSLLSMELNIRWGSVVATARFLWISACYLNRGIMFLLQRNRNFVVYDGAIIMKARKASLHSFANKCFHLYKELETLALWSAGARLEQ